MSCETETPVAVIKKNWPATRLTGTMTDPATGGLLAWAGRTLEVLLMATPASATVVPLTSGTPSDGVYWFDVLAADLVTLGNPLPQTSLYCVVNVRNADNSIFTWGDHNLLVVW